MNRIAKIFRRLKKWCRQQLTRERVVVGVIIFSSAYFIGFSITSMTRNWELEQTLLEKQREKILVKLEVEMAKLENQYYASDEYQELSARLRQNKKAPGESMVYLPENTQEAKDKHQSEREQVVEVEKPSNLEQWIAFLFGI